MDKITHQVRAEHWTKIMNECIKLILCKQDQFVYFIEQLFFSGIFSPPVLSYGKALYFRHV